MPIIKQSQYQRAIKKSPLISIAWQQEMQRRITEVEKGEVVCIPWEQVLQRLRGNTHVAG